MLFALVIACLCLAYANGANDNFKGVATLFGSGTSDYRRALSWATATTLLGSLAAVLLAGRLLRVFSGKGLIADSLVGEPTYAAAVALGAGLTVLLATRIGMPISTTHGLVGALVGAGLAAGSPINVAQLGGGFFLPLLVSPLVAAAATLLCYPLLRQARLWLSIGAQTCVCVGTETVEIVPHLNSTAALARAERLTFTTGNTVTCRYAGRVLGIEAGWLLGRLHYLSAGAVSFARGLNDTPKIAALLLVTPLLGGFGGVALVGLAIAVGGWLSARRVAETMSCGITPMNHGQGFTANFVSGVIIVGASRFGLPVSTTHVTCGSLFGIAAVTREGRLRTITTILAAWVTTLPVGAALGYVCYAILA